MPRTSFSGRIAAIVVANVVIAALLTIIAVRVFDRLGVNGFIAFITALAIAVPIAIWSTQSLTQRFVRMLLAVGDGVRGLRDQDFSLRLAVHGDDEISELARLYNDVADVLRAQRNEIYQKELLLDTILQGTPIAVVLVNPADRVIYSNAAAREMIGGGTRLDGRHFSEVVAALVDPMRNIVASGSDAIFTLTMRDQEETFHFAQRVFHLNTQRHVMIMLERLTPELRRQEINVWKKAIRTINHELNNSLAPVSSLVHSARHIQEHPEHADRLDEIYGTIEERLQHLRSFLEGYAQFARLPTPRKESLLWSDLLGEVRGLYPFRVEGRPESGAFIDRAQMQQVMINLLKNAVESGSPGDEIVIGVEPSAHGTTLRVFDRGRGMDEATMRQALLPFYSTKPSGTGLGLAVCNEIVDAHGGRITLHRRAGGGMAVTCWIPAA
jgi:two-component system, NtrC family, nitrogen regulation sensor histidine kinase NtrY